MSRMVRVSDEVYRRLQEAKIPGETFSDTLRRLLGQGDLTRLQGLRTPRETFQAEQELQEIDRLDQPE